MKNYIKYLLIVVVIAICIFPGYVFSFDNLSPSKQPNGFRGVYWESDKNTHTYLFTMYDNIEGVELFNRECELLTIGAARLGEIRYHFYHNKFYQVTLMVDNNLDYKSLLDELINAFGNPEDESGVYIWENDTVSIRLYQRGAAISYLPILNKINQ